MPRPSKTTPLGFRIDPVEPPELGLTHAGENWWPAGQQIPLHQHRIWEWYLQLEGWSRWRSETEEIRIGPGDLLIVPPGVDHALEENPQPRHRFLYFGVDLARHRRDLPGLIDHWPAGRWSVLRGATGVQIPLRLLLQQIGRTDDLRPALVRAAVLLVLGESMRLDAPGNAPPVWPKDPEMATVLRGIQDDPAAPWTVERLAALAGLSRSRFCQRFTSEIGTSVHRHVLQARLNLATSLLADPAMKVAEAAKRAGFSSASHLSRALRRQRGQRPAEHRRAN